MAYDSDIRVLSSDDDIILYLIQELYHQVNVRVSASLIPALIVKELDEENSEEGNEIFIDKIDSLRNIILIDESMLRYQLREDNYKKDFRYRLIYDIPCIKVYYDKERGFFILLPIVTKRLIKELKKYQEKCKRTNSTKSRIPKMLFDKIASFYCKGLIEAMKSIYNYYTKSISIFQIYDRRKDKDNVLHIMNDSTIVCELMNISHSIYILQTFLNDWEPVYITENEIYYYERFSVLRSLSSIYA